MRNLFIIVLVVSLSGCSKEFLDKRSLTQIGDGNFWQSESDAQLGINGIYDVLQDRVQYSGNLNGTAGLTMYDCFGDNLYNNYKFEGPGNFMIGNIDPSNAFFSDLWRSLYRGIGRANVALENIERMPASAISDESKNALIGQALFLRSLFYMNLAVYFQEVPLILKVQSLDEAYVTKNSFQEVATQVVQDLETAAGLLPVNYPVELYGYATRGAALGLLARFQLYLGNYQAVLDATNTILSLGYGLNPNYAQLFTEQGEQSNEILFSVRFNQDASNNGELFSATFLGIPKVDQNPMRNLVNDYYCTDGLPITTSPLYNAATPKANRDPRLGASVYFRTDIFLTDLNRAFNGNTPTGFALRKYTRRTSVSSTGIGAFSPGGQDFIVLRYADVLLMRAEAFVELNQPGEAYPLVNQVRARSGMPAIEDVEGSGLGQTEMRNIVRHERRVELAFEGLRYFDLKRWGTVQEAFQRAQADNVPGYPVNYRAGKAEVFPIPLSELNANSNMVQNPVWD